MLMVRSTYMSGIGDDKGINSGKYEQASVDDENHSFTGKVESNPEMGS